MVKILLIKTLLLSKLMYGIEILNCKDNEFDKYDIKFNRIIIKILGLAMCYPRDILRFECGILKLKDLVKIKRFRLRMKCRELNLNDIYKDIIIDDELIKLNNINQCKEYLWDN